MPEIILACDVGEKCASEIHFTKAWRSFNLNCMGDLLFRNVSEYCSSLLRSSRYASMEFLESERSSCKYCLKRILYEFQLLKKCYIYAMKLIIINGPNLNLLGIREKDVYGDESFEDYLEILRAMHPKVTIDYYQSNVEGELINE